MTERPDLIEYMETEVLAAAFDPDNPMQHGDAEIARLTGSIHEYGFLQPVVYNKRTGHLVAGHGRVEAARAAGYDALPTVVVDFDETQEAAANIALNGNYGHWDEGKLAEVLRDLQTQDYDLDLTGLEPYRLDELLGQTDLRTDFLADPDDVPAEPEGEPITQRGDVIVLGRHRLMCGDSTSEIDVARLMEGQKAKLMVTDPPYAVDYVEKARDMNQRGYVHSRATLRAAISGDSIEAGQEAGLWRDAFSLAIASALESSAAIYIWHAQGRAMLDLYNLLLELGLLHHQTIIWVKNNFVIGRCDYQWKHEPCFYGWLKGNRPPFYGEKNQTTVWDIQRDTQTPDHPTQKPVAIFEPQMRNHLRSGEVAYDPFVGSGTAIIAAEQAGCRCYGMELEPLYCDVIVSRWEKFTGLTAQRPERVAA